MSTIKQVMDYSHLSYFDVLNLPLDVFMLMRKNYIIDELRQTEEGRKYLDDCERLKRKDMDIDTLFKTFGGEKK